MPIAAVLNQERVEQVDHQLASFRRARSLVSVLGDLDVEGKNPGTFGFGADRLQRSAVIRLTFVANQKRVVPGVEHDVGAVLRGIGGGSGCTCFFVMYIRPERRRRQLRRVVENGQRVVRPAEAGIQRRRDAGRSERDRVALDLRLRPGELAVGPGDGEDAVGVTLEVQPRRVVEHQLDRPAADDGPAERRAAALEVRAVGVVQDALEQPFADLLLVVVVDIFHLAQIDCHDQRRVQLLRRRQLRLAQQRPDVSVGRLVATFPEVRQLHQVERHLRAKAAAPVVNQRRQQRAVLHGLLLAVAVGFALVPDDSLHLPRQQRRDLPVEQHRGRVGIFDSLAGAGVFAHLVDRPLEVGHRRQRRGADPCLCHGPAGRGVDQPDRDLELLLQVAAEKVTDAGKVDDRLRRAHLPRAAGDRPLRRGRRGAGDAQQAKHGVIGGGDLLLEVVRAADVEGHVRLTAAQPDVAEQDVVSLRRLAGLLIRHVQRVRPAGRVRRDRHGPASVGPGRRRFLSAVQLTDTDVPGCVQPQSEITRSRCNTAFSENSGCRKACPHRQPGRPSRSEKPLPGRRQRYFSHFDT